MATEERMTQKGTKIKIVFGVVILATLYILAFPFSAQLMTDLRTPFALRMFLTLLYFPLLFLASQSESFGRLLSWYVELVTGAIIGFG